MIFSPHEGIGISANQIGIWERAFAMVRDLENNEVCNGKYVLILVL